MKEELNPVIMMLGELAGVDPSHLQEPHPEIFYKKLRRGLPKRQVDILSTFAPEKIFYLSPLKTGPTNR